jgi:hypothetical protein
MLTEAEEAGNGQRRRRKKRVAKNLYKLVDPLNTITSSPLGHDILKAAISQI